MVKGAKCFHLVTKLGCQGVLLWFLLHQLSLHFSVLEAICSVSGGDALTSLINPKTCAKKAFFTV
jgi:hypothetical protein